MGDDHDLTMGTSPQDEHCAVGEGSELKEMQPRDAWDRLSATEGAALIDVRSRPEWAFVGVTDLQSIGRPMVLAEWLGYPDMTINPGFYDEVVAKLGNDQPRALFFLCRSGSRSRDAAVHFEATARDADKPVPCFNILEGFEGDLDPAGHRGTVNGWKQSGLPWRQS